MVQILLKFSMQYPSFKNLKKSITKFFEVFLMCFMHNPTCKALTFTVNNETPC